MQKSKKYILSTLVSMLCFLHLANAQFCNLPILSNFENTTKSGFNSIWIDFNSSVEYYEIEFGIKSFPRTFTPNVTNITENNYQFIDLLPGTTYELYIRSVCSADNKSEWNGPYFNNTNIDNNSSCALDLNITDDNCPNRNRYNIEVTDFDSKILGTDINLENIALTIEHTWPPDLDIQLTSPNGKTALLTSHNGNGVDHYGTPDGNCNLNANFNDKACISVNNWAPPFLGSFKAEEELASTFNGEPANGIWQLSICDRALGDIGKLNYVNLEFSTETCQAPQDFVIFDIEGTSATFNWQSFDNCNSIRFTYNEINAPPEEVFIDIIECDIETFTATGLKPNTVYELNINTECQAGISSNSLCALSFQTRCTNSSFLETFDQLNDCQLNCDSICNLTGLWNTGDQDNRWFIQSKNIVTTFSGPESDKNGQGKFLQIDPSLSCTNNNIATIVTDCLEMTNSGDCTVSFFYHMYGSDVGKLYLEYIKQDGQWRTLWEKSGNQGNQWFFATVDIDSDVTKSKIRFRTESQSNASQGIIALDHIKIYNSQITSLNTFYQDLDNDGFGNRDSIVLLCSEFAIPGFSINDLDCDDQNENINPDAIEISCNQIDENCNGNLDDAQTIDIEVEIIEIIDEKCKGSSDGSITIQANLGVPPFIYNWSNGSSGTINSNLTTGIYTCTITGNDGCQTVTAPIFVGFKNILVYNVNEITNSSCQGTNNGSISINIDGGIEPYSIIWDNGDIGLQSSNLESGSYQATISSSDGCNLITDPIEVIGNQIITTGVAIKNDIDCTGESTGFIQLGIVGGITPYQINWNNGDTTAFVDNLIAGIYSVTITDSQGCFNTIESIQIEEPIALNATINRKRDIRCNNDNDGQIDINVNGGTPPYSYFWSNGSFTQDLFNLQQGNYSVTITDFKACSIILDDILIEEPNRFEIVLDSISSVSCSGSNEGFVSINVSGGTLPYSYNWSTRDGVSSDVPSINNLLPGQYFVTVVDAFGCKSLPGIFEINNQNVPINISLLQQDQIQCHFDSTASIIALSASTNLPLDFNWSAGIKNIKNNIADTISFLPSGMYNLTITDSEGCVGISDTINISQPNIIEFEVVELEDNNCFNEESGLISINARGGTGSLSYLWSNNSNESTIDQLANGLYNIQIIDQLGCELISEDIKISSPDSLFISSIITPSDLNNNGSINIDVRGGIEPYTYMWDIIGIGNESLVDNLSSGDYSLTIIDANDCIIDSTFTVDFISSNQNLLATELVLLYPNPANDKLHIRCLENNCEIEIVDINGKSIFESKINGTLDIDTYQFSSGTYFVKTKQAQFFQISKIIILH